MAPGVLVFRDLRSALDEGFHVYDRLQEGYLVRRMTNGRWELAIVDLTDGRKGLRELPDSPHLHQ